MGYWSLLNTIVASSDYSANETIVNDSIKAVICAGLNHMVSNNMNSKTDQAWTLRFIMDAVKDDIMDQPRDNDVTWLPSASSVMKNSNRDVCTARTSVSPGKLIASLDTNQATLLPPTLPPTQKDIPKTGDESPPMKKCRNSKMVIYITKRIKRKNVVGSRTEKQSGSVRNVAERYHLTAIRYIGIVSWRVENTPGLVNARIVCPKSFNNK